MSSARKRAAIQKANNEADHLRRRLVLAEYHAAKIEAFAFSVAAKADALQARIDELMLEYCPEEMTEAQKANWARHQRPVSDEEEAKVVAALMGSNVEVQGRGAAQAPRSVPCNDGLGGDGK